MKAKHWLVAAADRYDGSRKGACCATMAFNVFVGSAQASADKCPWCGNKRAKKRGK